MDHQNRNNVKFFVGISEELTPPKKWTTIESKISETSCDIICLQETKGSFLTIRL
jgi:exonuclease III